MNTALSGYIKFFNDQIDEMLLEYQHVLKSPIRQLIEADKAYCVSVCGVSLQRGHVMLKILGKKMPRLKVVKSMVLVKRAARLKWGERIDLWDCSFGEFLSKADNHSASSLVQPLYYLRSKRSDGVVVGCGGVSSKMFAAILKLLDSGKNVFAIMYETEPPTRYLANLANYIERNENDSVLLTKPIISYDQWSPALLAYDAKNPDVISKTVLKAVEDKQKIVLQGPPGTGKSYSAAQVIADYLGRNKSVCVTAMANKALMELILQPPLAKFLADGRLSKTMLSPDEALAAKGVKEADSDYVVPKGEALFATYYKFSNLFRSIENGMPNRLYDLVVVEEASQAYLTTIAASLKLGKDCLIVGDPMQLSPIIRKENKPEYKRWNAVVQAEGLSSFVLGTDVKSFRITTTFRLTKAATSLTGIFYGNTLTSVAPDVKGWDDLHGEQYFPQGGGTIYQNLEGGEDCVLSKAAVSTMNEVLMKLLQKRRKSSVAIITPFKDSAKAIQSKFSFEDSELDLSVETIDRVQGATVDYTILYFSLPRKVGFALDERRFNVATSRSRTTTLILSDFDLLSMGSITGKVREYLEKVKGVYRDTPEDNSDASSAVAIQPLTCERAEVSAMPTLADVQSLLDKLQARLALWLQAWLAVMHPTNLWQNAVVPNLSSLQLQNAKDNGDRRIIDLDLMALLSVFIGNFKALRSQAHIKQEMQTMAFHIKEVRHDYAHKKTTVILNAEPKTLQYHVDTMSRFLEGLSDMPPATPPSKPSTVIKRGGITITAS